MKLTPERIAAAGTESAHQQAFFAALRLEGDPLLALFHSIPNGGERNVVVASKMKAEGARRGVWDTFLPVQRGGRAGLYIEFKKPEHRTHKNGGLSDAQIEFGLAVHAQGYATHVCYTWDEALEVVRAYLKHKT